MSEKESVWRGISYTSVFESFATFGISIFSSLLISSPMNFNCACRCYFDCPTSTTTDRKVAENFARGKKGIILELKSKYNENCATMLEVSPFSMHPDGKFSAFVISLLIKL